MDLEGQLSNPDEAVETLAGQGPRASRRSHETPSEGPNRASDPSLGVVPEEMGRLSNPVLRRRSPAQIDRLVTPLCARRLGRRSGRPVRRAPHHGDDLPGAPRCRPPTTGPQDERRVGCPGRGTVRARRVARGRCRRVRSSPTDFGKRAPPSGNADPTPSRLASLMLTRFHSRALHGEPSLQLRCESGPNTGRGLALAVPRTIRGDSLAAKPRIRRWRVRRVVPCPLPWRVQPAACTSCGRG